MRNLLLPEKCKVDGAALSLLISGFSAKMTRALIRLICMKVQIVIHAILQYHKIHAKKWPKRVQI